MEPDAGPVYVILGGTGGIGSELTRTLAADGARLFIGGRDEAKLRELADETGARSISLDATRSGEVEAIFAATVEEYGRIDGAANLVGSFMLKPAHLTTDEELAQTLSLNLTTTYSTVRSSARHMPDGVSVVLLSSVAALVGLANHEAIAAAKGAVQTLAFASASSYAARGLRFNVATHGLTQPAMPSRVTRNDAAR